MSNAANAVYCTPDVFSNMVSQGILYDTDFGQLVEQQDGVFPGLIIELANMLCLKFPQLKSLDELLKSYYIECCKIRYIKPTNHVYFRFLVEKYLILNYYSFYYKFNESQNKQLKYCFWTVTEWLAMFFELKPENSVFKQAYLSDGIEENIDKRFINVSQSSSLKIPIVKKKEK